jgi:hypothetical protein
MRATILYFYLLSALVAASAPTPGTLPVASVLRVHQTEHFTIQHDASDEWADKLGCNLESMARQFHQQTLFLGTAGRSTLNECPRMAWFCLTDGLGENPQQLVHFKASYDTRLHRVQLAWGERAPGRSSDSDLPPSTSAFEPDGLTSVEDGKRFLLTRVSHELAHQLAFDCGLQKRGVMYPLWVAEGLATNFELPVQESCFLGDNPPRRRRLEALAEEHLLIPLSSLVVLTDTSSFSHEERIDLYAEAWGLFRFMALEREDALRAYLEKLAALPCGQRTDAEMLEEWNRFFGPVADVEKSWRTWMENTPPDPADVTSAQVACIPRSAD